MFDTVKEYIQAFFNTRLMPLAVVFVLLFSVLVNRMFQLQIVNSDKIISKGISNKIKEKDIKATRGNIYDCNGRLLAYNKLSYNVIFSETDKLTDMSNEEKNQMIEHLLKILDKHNNPLTVEFYLQYNKQGALEYSVDGSLLEQFMANAFSVSDGVRGLTQEQKDTTPEEMYQHLMKIFEISDSYDKETALKIMTVRYAMFINRYVRYQDVVLARDVDDATVAAVKENNREIPGIDIEQNTSRVYKKSKYFAHILGYTGAVSSEKMEKYNQKKANKGNEYTLDDQMGISGLESNYEKYLRGIKGKKEITIDGGTSRILAEEITKEPVAGNDLQLTIDAGLQEECYHLLEEHIAGILISHINNSIYAGTRGHSTKDIRIPIFDVYNALVQNNIVDTSRFEEADASALEKKTLKQYQNKKRVILRKIRDQLETGGNTGHVSSDMQDFLDYYYELLKENSVVLTNQVDTEDMIYKNFANGRVSLAKYLQYAISKQWINLETLKIGDEFFSTKEIYQKLIDYGIDLLKDDVKFTKMVYSFLIYHYQLSGRDLCLLLFDQGDIKYNETEYDQIRLGLISPYSFLLKKIKKLEITPGELGLDPCSGSIIITDVNTGDVKAMVTYPSYDNNKMANQVDSEYFYKYLTDNTGSPLLNRPTQQEIAPGSTFKMVSSVAALEEGVVSPGETVYDTVVFDKVYGSPRCWSTSSHGNLTVSTAIEHSCNVFFYEMGYRLGRGHGHQVDNSLGLSRLKKYADMFGLTSKSGVEVAESSPHFSTQDIVRSCIGQANHAYAPVQLSRYVTTLANNGTCYDLTLIDKITDVDGKTILDNKAKVRNQVKIADSTWNSVHRGMYLVVNGAEHGAIFAGMKKTFAGKTGTAQQNTMHPNHAYFISYGPYKDPEISVTCVIPNGYTSTYAMELARDVYKGYFGKKKISGGKAKTVGHYAGSND